MAGQRDVTFLQGPITPLQRFWSGGDAVALMQPGADLVHTINAIPLVMPRRLIITFEDYLPRIPDDRPNPSLDRMLTRRLFDRRCEALLAMSDYARAQFAAQHSGAPGYDELSQKTEVVYPAVPIRRAQAKNTNLDRGTPLRLLAVGRDWLRKGFPAIVEAHERLIAAGVNVETTVVSSLRWSPDDYVGPRSQRLHDDFENRLNASGVKHLSEVDNNIVRKLMDEADIYLHPTLHDTFGYVLIEALSGGTPVIATETCAAPEIVDHGRSGYLLPMRNRPDLHKWEWLYRNSEDGYEDAYLEFIGSAAEGIAQHVADLEENRDQLAALEAGALDKARNRFSIDILRTKLEQLYGVSSIFGH